MSPRFDIGMMRDASDEAVGQLLDRWKRGDRDVSAWNRLLRGPMRRGAWRGIQRMTGQPPNEGDDVAMAEASSEMERNGMRSTTKRTIKR